MLVFFAAKNWKLLLIWYPGIKVQFAYTWNSSIYLPDLLERTLFDYYWHRFFIRPLHTDFINCKYTPDLEALIWIGNISGQKKSCFKKMKYKMINKSNKNDYMHKFNYLFVSTDPSTKESNHWWWIILIFRIRLVQLYEIKHVRCISRR